MPARCQQLLQAHLLDPAVVGRDSSEHGGFVVVVAAKRRAKADDAVHFPPAISPLAVQWAPRVPLAERGTGTVRAAPLGGF